MKVLVKELIQTTWDYDFDNNIGNWAVKDLYNKIDNYFSKKSEESVKLEKELPYSENGIIFSSKCKNLYSLNDCLIGLEHNSVFLNNYAMRLVIAGEEEKVRCLEKIFNGLSLMSNVYSCVSNDLYNKARKESFFEHERRVSVEEGASLSDCLKLLGKKGVRVYE